MTDTVTGYLQTFLNPSGNPASVADTSGFHADATPTPVTPGPTPTPTPSGGATRIVNVGPGGLSVFRDTVSNNSTTTIKVGDTVQWNFVTSNYHSATSGTCSSGGDPYGGGYVTCDSDGKFDSQSQISPATYSKKFTTAGQYPYYCNVHGSMMTGMVIVNP